jgi:hypothetical protein
VRVGVCVWGGGGGVVHADTCLNYVVFCLSE